MSEKLQKVLARAGLGSRRSLEQKIAAGLIAVNGQIATLGTRIEGTEAISIDGQRVELAPKIACEILMYHKPEGELCTRNDPQNRPTVFDHLPNPQNGKWNYIGRLDLNSSGLLLLSTDGELVHRMTHPKHEIERIYAVRVYGEVSEELLEKLQQGIKLEDGPAHFDSIQFAGGEGRNSWYHVSLREGRKREVRRMWEAIGLKVSRLIRISYAGLALDSKLKSGSYRHLNLSEINLLRQSVDLEALDADQVVVAERKQGSELFKPKANQKRGQTKNSKYKQRVRGEKAFEKSVFAKDKSYNRSKGRTVKSKAR